jgi:membrane protein implicated in regulation of membrane protease activity
MGRPLVILGLVLVAAGLLWPWVSRLGLGHLPGDVSFQGKHGGFYFPITTCILVSVALSVLWWLLHR